MAFVVVHWRFVALAGTQLTSVAFLVAQNYAVNL